MTFLRVHPEDDMIVALADHGPGDPVDTEREPFLLADAIPAKHKAAARDIRQGELLKMYGLIVGRAVQDISQGCLISTRNLVHATGETRVAGKEYRWIPPDVTAWSEQTFAGYHRDDGRVGTRNYWLVVPLVFCENRNIRMLRRAMLDELGYGMGSAYQQHTRRLVELYRQGATAEEIRVTEVELRPDGPGQERVFANVDGVKFLTHAEGCGVTFHDSHSLCGLLAGYINHPNVAGATVLSLGCQKSQIEFLEQQIHARNPQFKKPLYIFEQQQLPSEQAMLTAAIQHTFAGLIEANKILREPTPLDRLCVGLECGGSDGFSGLSANPAIGSCSDRLVALGGSVILAEFPELAGCEADLAFRCQRPDAAARFLKLMQDYENRLRQDGTGFESNPSPGNVRDGLITDAMKSAGAAKKGGTAPVADVLDYPEPVCRDGLNLLCTPGGDVESTTALAGSGANIILFSTGLGTPTGNVVAPTIKIATNTSLAMRLADLIDIDAGPIIEATASIDEIGERILGTIVATASGTYQTKAERLGQDDFIPWRRNMSL